MENTPEILEAETRLNSWALRSPWARDLLGHPVRVEKIVRMYGQLALSVEDIAELRCALGDDNRGFELRSWFTDLLIGR